MTLRERISNNATRCQLNKQSLDIPAINHIVLGKFTIVNFAFILPPLPPQQTRSVFTIVKWEKPVTLENVFTVVRDRSFFMCVCVGEKNHGVGQAYFLEKRGEPKENSTMIGGGSLCVL